MGVCPQPTKDQAKSNLKLNLFLGFLMGRYSITDGQLQQLHSTGMSWSAVSEALGVNRSTVFRRRRLFGMNTDEASRFSDIPDADLDTVLTSILHHSPNAGETYVHGSLRARGIKVQRWRIRERLQVIQTN